MKKWNIIIDVDNCNNCNMCSLATKDEYVGNSFPGYSAEMPKRGANWIEMKKKERGQTPMIDIAYIPTMCQHCDDAPCLKASKNGAITKRSDGIIIIDPEKSKGQKQIVESCPHNSIYWNEELNIPQIWSLDAHLLDDGWKAPRAVSVCATSAMKAVKIEDNEMEKLVKNENLETLNPEHNTKPRVYYKNLHRYNKCFIGGSITSIKNKIEDCVKDAKVELYKDELLKEQEMLAETISDDFGDFKFDKLEPNSGKYLVKIKYKKNNKTVLVDLNESINLGNIYI
tara:strand:+ start:3310 stop:4161 length:852 start_codon:yes stop_codon:yes gene_type:complete